MKKQPIKRYRRQSYERGSFQQLREAIDAAAKRLDPRALNAAEYFNRSRRKSK
jgi:hypothetical protein